MNNVIGIISGLDSGVITVATFIYAFYKRNCGEDLENVVEPVIVPVVVVVDINDLPETLSAIVVENHHHK